MGSNEINNMAILRELENSGKNFGKQFSQNMCKILANPKSDIIDTLNKSDDYSLSVLRIKLFSNIVEMSPEFEKYDLIIRRKKQKMSDDIYTMGHSLVNKCENS